MPHIASSFLLGRLQTTASQWLNETCTIEVQDFITNEIKSQVKAWIVVADDVPCRVIQATSRSSSSEAALVGKQESLAELYRIALPPKGSATYTWDLTVNQRITVNGHAYHVIAVEQELTDNVFRSALVTRELAGSSQ